MHPSPGLSERLDSIPAPRTRLTARRPLCGVLLSVVCGVLSGFGDVLNPGIVLLAGWLLLIAGTIPRWHRIRPAVVFGLFFIVAAVLAQLRLHPPAPDYLGNRMRRPVEHLAVCGTIADDPVRLAGRHPESRVWQFPLRVDRIRREVDWQNASGTIWVRLDTLNPRIALHYGERLLLEGNVTDRRAWSPWGKSLALRLDDGAARRVRELDGGSRFMRWCLAGRRWCADRLAIGIADQPAAVALIHALVLGYRHELPRSARDAFAKTGTMHIVAISGAHVAMVAWLLLAVVRMVGVPQPRWIFCMAPLLLLYACSTGMAPSTLRACMMAFCFFAASAVWRQPDSLSALACSAILLLAINPTQLASPGFLLSYTVVAALILLYPPCRDALLRVAMSSSALAAPTPIARRLNAVGRRLIELMAVTTVAWAVSTPLIAFWFHLVSPIALLANLFIVPLAFFILFAASLSLGVGWVHPLAQEIYNRAAAFFCDMLFSIIEWHAALPGGFIRVESPPVAVVALSPVVLFLLVLGTRRVRRFGWAMLAIGCVVLVALCLSRREQVVAIRHLGPSAVAHVRIPGGGDWLFDTGPAFTAPLLEKFLIQRGVDRLRGVVIMRATMEAGGALPALVEREWVGEVWVPDTRIRSRPFAEMLGRMVAQGIPVKRRAAQLVGGEMIGDACLRILNPFREVNYPNAMAGGFALHVSRGPASLLLLPGNDRKLLAALAALRADLGSQIVVELGARAREGAEDPLEWFDRLRPAWLIRAAGLSDRFRDAPEPIDSGSVRTQVRVLQPDETLIIRATSSGYAPVGLESSETGAFEFER